MRTQSAVRLARQTRVGGPCAGGFGGTPSITGAIQGDGAGSMPAARRATVTDPAVRGGGVVATAHNLAQASNW